MDQLWIVQHQFAHSFDIAAPDCICHPAGKHQPRPTRQPVTPGKRKLRVGQFGGVWIGWLGVMSLQLCQRGRFTLLDGAEQVVGLVFELFKVRADGKVTICKLTVFRLTSCHDGPPWVVVPVVRCLGRKEIRNERLLFKSLRWTRSSPRTGGVLYANASIPRTSE